jgi:hypothetical protein
MTSNYAQIQVLVIPKVYSIKIKIKIKIKCNIAKFMYIFLLFFFLKKICIGFHGRHASHFNFQVPAFQVFFIPIS